MLCVTHDLTAAVKQIRCIFDNKHFSIKKNLFCRRSSEDSNEHPLYNKYYAFMEMTQIFIYHQITNATNLLHRQINEYL